MKTPNPPQQEDAPQPLPAGNPSSDFDWEPAAGAGWDQAKDSVKPGVRSLGNPNRVRLWRQSRWLTLVVAALQWSPAILFCFPVNLEITACITLVATMVISCGLALLPWVSANLVNLFYPVWWATAWIFFVKGRPGSAGQFFSRLGEFTIAFFADLHEWPFWLLRIVFLAAVVQVIYKAVRMLGRSLADKNAIRYWWRRPVNDVIEQPWS